MTARKAGLCVWSALIALQAADCVSTKAALAAGGYESNNLMVRVVELPLPVLLFFKVGLALGFGVLWVSGTRRASRFSAWASLVPLVALCAFYCVVVAGNLRIAL